MFKKVLAFGVTRAPDPRAWPGWRPPEGGGIIGKRRQSVGNEEIAFAHEQKRNAHEEIAFAREQKRNAREEIAFPECGRGAKEESRIGLLRVSHRRPSWKNSAPSR